MQGVVKFFCVLTECSKEAKVTGLRCDYLDNCLTIFTLKTKHVNVHLFLQLTNKSHCRFMIQSKKP